MKFRNSIWAAQMLPILLAVLAGIVVGVYHGWLPGLLWALTLFVIKQPFVLWSRYREAGSATKSARSERMHWLWAQVGGPFEAFLTIVVLFGLQLGWVKGVAMGFGFLLPVLLPLLWHYVRTAK